MPNVKRPRHGTMQYWPRKRAKRAYARVRSLPTSSEAKPLEFAGYKAGMTHVQAIDNRPNAMTKGEEISFPVTIIECPPLKVMGIHIYKNTTNGLILTKTILNQKQNKELERKIRLPKKAETEQKLNEAEPLIQDPAIADIRLLVHTQPKLTGIGKKKPEVFEIKIGGKIPDKWNYAKENLGKELTIDVTFKEGQSIDVHSITKGKGFQGPVKRFGVSLRSHKSEKTKRGPGSLGAWNAQGHITYRVAHAGQMGFHQRTEYNKWLLKISKNPEEVNQSSGIKHYGNVKSHFLLLKGSVPGAAHRLIRLVSSIRKNKRMPEKPIDIQLIAK